MAAKYRFDICEANSDGSGKVLVSCTFEARDAEQADAFKKATLEAWKKIYPHTGVETEPKMSVISNQ
ncbi:MAG: hypothetical protein JSS82_16420 [Bacteroidetes bacterium]|nr:hypothetical protein [Bacteroidota bacterium]